MPQQVPRPLGIVLVHGYHKIDAELVAPLVRSNIESSIDLIATNKAEFAAVVKRPSILDPEGLDSAFHRFNMR